MKHAIAMVLVVSALLAACGPPPGHKTKAEREAEAAAMTQQRIADLVAINAALEKRRASEGAYPVSDGFQGYASAWGASLGELWIPELTEPTPFPRDPAKSEAGNEAQYLYFSDGKDYKLLAHVTNDCGPSVEVQGIRIDSRRSAGAECWGYGFWSAGAESF